jgi:hypothetical protein
MTATRKQLSKSRTKTSEKSTSKYLVKNYGLFWKEENVFWGKKGKSGTLLGKPAKGSFKKVDFRDQIGIYVLYADYKVVYIGQAGSGSTSNLFARLSKHRNNELAGRWNQFSWFGLLAVLKDNTLASSKQNHNHNTKVVLDHFEAMLIHVIEPPLNKQGGKWGEGEQYLQLMDKENIGINDAEVLREILEKIKK